MCIWLSCCTTRCQQAVHVCRLIHAHPILESRCFPRVRCTATAYHRFVVVLCPDTEPSFRQGSSLPLGLSSAAMTEYGGRVFLFGGVSSSAEYLNTVFSSEDGQTWMQHENATWTPRSNHAACSAGVRLVLCRSPMLDVCIVCVVCVIQGYALVIGGQLGTQQYSTDVSDRACPHGSGACDPVVPVTHFSGVGYDIQ